MTPPPGKKPTARDLSLARPSERRNDAVSLGAAGVTTGRVADFPRVTDIRSTPPL